MKNIISQIKHEADQLYSKTDEEISSIVELLKRRSKNESLDGILSAWFALTQEVSFRKLGLRHFDNQLLGGYYLHQGNVVEMKTGEGKTLVSTLPVSLNALKGLGTHVVTVNDYLAERDQQWMGKVYKGLNLSVGLIKSTSTVSQRQLSYGSDITYITNSELVFDYLRDSSTINQKELVQRDFSFCLIDEIDSILIDEARTPLILSTSQENTDINKLYFAKLIALNLEKDLDFEMDEKRRDLFLTECGYERVKQQLGKESLYEIGDSWMLEILNALKAHHFFRLNKEYVILNNKIVIVDEFTGRIMEDRRWSNGLHEAVEVKENLPVGGATKAKSSITYQNFFTLYPKLAGMTGTAKTVEREFYEIYSLPVIVLPTHKPLLRDDRADVVYQSELVKWKKVLETSKDCYQKGQPVLIGTSTIEKSEILSDLFSRSGISHKVLNAKPENVARESEIVAQAGERFAVTIATNMAGRGTDIILGGNPSFKVKQELKILFSTVSSNSFSSQLFLIQKESKEMCRDLAMDIDRLPYSLESCSPSLRILYDNLLKEITQKWKIENEIVKDLGGLFVLGTERHESRRIDDQLRGRAGRQGDPGVSQFFVSLDDDLIKIFGGDSIRGWITSFLQDEETPLDSSFLTKSLENAQQKVESYNYEIRKNVFEYDGFLNFQRAQFFDARKQWLCDDIVDSFSLRILEKLYDEEKSVSSRLFFSDPFFESSSFRHEDFLTLDSYQRLWIDYELENVLVNTYHPGFRKKSQSILFLTILDFYWTEHVERMSLIRETVNWRAYGQQDPLIEYNLEALNSFWVMLQQIHYTMIYYSFRSSFF